LSGGLVVSCGLGEDASFDTELANRFGAKMAILDPTPRAIVHYHAMVGRIGRAAECGYAEGGKQPVTAYNLSQAKPDQFSLIPCALWIEEGTVTFHPPANPAHVSHSIRFDAGGDTAAIEVSSVTFAQVLERLGASDVAILKMDIEGAETDIIETIESWPVLPRQILVEFDVLREPGRASRQAVEAADQRLREHGYACAHIEGRNYLYLR
jgi:FkbM family methyltransferase